MRRIGWVFLLAVLLPTLSSMVSSASSVPSANAAPVVDACFAAVATFTVQLPSRVWSVADTSEMPDPGVAVPPCWNSPATPSGS